MKMMQRSKMVPPIFIGRCTPKILFSLKVREYSLTQLGTSIVPPLKGMCRWAKRHGRRVSAEVRLRETHQAQ
jgi:hypothetical protein